MAIKLGKTVKVSTIKSTNVKNKIINIGKGKGITITYKKKKG